MYSDSLATIDGRLQPPIPQYTLSEAEQQLRVLNLSVALLIARTEFGEVWTEGFADVAVLLQAEPLATAEFRSATNHLQNALRYCHFQEFGAAAFELRVVRGILQKV